MRQSSFWFRTTATSTHRINDNLFMFCFHMHVPSNGLILRRAFYAVLRLRICEFLFFLG